MNLSIHSFIRSSIHLFIYSFIHSFIHHSVVESLIHQSIHLFIHSSIHSFFHLSLLSYIFWATAPKGTMSCRTLEDFCWFARAAAHPPPPFRLRSLPRCSNHRCEAQIPAWRLKYQPKGSNTSFEAKSQLWGSNPAWRLKYQPQGSNFDLTNSIRQKSPCVLQDIIPFGPLLC